MHTMTSFKKFLPYSIGSSIALMFYCLGIFLSDWPCIKNSHLFIFIIFGALAAVLGVMVVEFIKNGPVS
jgi:hypothetical protein